MRRLASERRFDPPGATSSQYRRGAVMGLTMAEAFVLIAFALLLLLAVWKVQSDQEQARYRAMDGLSPRDIATASRLAEAGLLDEAAALARSGQLEAAATLAGQGVDLTRPEIHDVWRLIDQDELLRVMNAVEALPPGVQSDLADLVEIDDPEVLLQLLEITKRSTGQEDLQAKLLGVGQRLAAAEQDTQALINNLRSELGPIVADVGGTIEDNGAIVLPDSILFEQGRATITPVMHNLLGRLCEPWLRALMTADAPVASALIEGHASREWRSLTSADEAYLNNLALSQARSQAVLDACLRIVDDEGVRTWAHTHLAAVGYSSAKPVVVAGTEDQARSRRVVFSLSIDDSKLLKDVASDLGLQSKIR